MNLRAHENVYIVFNPTRFTEEVNDLVTVANFMNWPSPEYQARIHTVCDKLEDARETARQLLIIAATEVIENNTPQVIVDDRLS